MSAEGTLEPFVREIQQDPFYATVIDSDAFQRLAHISFLGAIDYVRDWELAKAQRTRFSHSLCVAALVKFVSDARGYDRDTERHVVCAALLHDIGHLPLSHSAEVVVKRRFNVGHHELADLIIDGDVELGRSLQPTLARGVDPERVKALISSRSEEKGADLFRAKINVDTIDGITRAAHYEKSEIDLDFALRVAEASFLRTDEVRFEQLDKFWLLKDRIYSTFIHGDLGLKADLISQDIFEGQRLDRKDLLSDERCWRDRLTTLSGLPEPGSLKAIASTSHFSYLSRKYSIKEDHLSEDRYVLDTALRTCDLTE